MSKLSEIWRRVQMLVRREKFARELEEEMRLHRELKEKELIADGLDASEARYAANRQFGNTMYLWERGREACGWKILCRTCVSERGCWGSIRDSRLWPWPRWRWGLAQTRRSSAW